MTHPSRSLPPLISRRRFLAAAGLALGAAALAGCGSDGSGGAAATGPSAAGFPLTIDGDEGPMTLEAPPGRVVSVGQYRDTDAAVALGLVPLATPDLSGFIEGGVSPWLRAALGSRPAPELLGTDAGTPFEKIAALRPELILATDSSTLTDDYSLLSRIAPTLSSLNGYNKDTWQVTTTRVGQALGQDARAAEIIPEVEARISAVKAGNPGFAGRTFTIGPVTAEGTVNTISRTDDASAIFMSQLGLELSPAVRDLPQGAFPGRAEISPERLDLIDADVVILTFNTPEAQERLEADRLFQRIPAVERGSYIALDLPTALAIAFPSALSIPYALDQSVPRIAEALAAT